MKGLDQEEVDDDERLVPYLVRPRQLNFPNQNNDPIESHYELGEQLGSGAFSVVVKGIHKKTRVAVAVKMVHKDQTNREEMYAELAVMSRLKHRNIVLFREIFEKKEHYYVIMELITGGELFDRIIELRHYSEKDASHVMHQALQGLKHMHDRDLVHRDLKPENLLLASKEPGADVKLADFGFATVCRGYELDDMVGTPPYMAPELAQLREGHNGGLYGKPVDVWAMGVILYILLSGIHPFQIDDEEKMLNNVEAGKWSWLGPYWAKISQDAQQLIQRMLDVNPKTRFTVDQCLSHNWFKDASAENLGDVAEAIKNFQAKKKLKGAILGIMAAGKMRNLVSALKAPTPPTTTTTTTTTTAHPTRPSAPTPAANPAPKPKPEVKPKKIVVVAAKLEVRVIAGKGLAAKDYNGKSDPYLRLFYGKTKLKTTTQKKTLNPDWNHETFLFPFDESEKILKVECWDWDRIGSDDFMGQFTVDVSSFETNKPVTQWYTLGPPPEKSKKKAGKISGSIQICVEKISD